MEAITSNFVNENMYSLRSLFLVVKQHKVELPSDKKNKTEEYVFNSKHTCRFFY
jgi:hypothetical protein